MSAKKYYSIALVCALPLLWLAYNPTTNYAATASSDVTERDIAPADLFVDDLVSKMTLTEKIGQLNQHAGFSKPTGPVDGNDGDTLKVERIKSGQVGSMLNVIGVDEIRFVQKLAVEESRLGIPLIFAHDVIHGYRTIFPIPLGEASSWDPALASKSARIAAVEASAEGLNWTFAPMVDISREPRWGRVMEGAGEDPFLGAAFAVARVRGFQGDDLSASDTILACIKHFAAYGWTQAGRDYTHAEVNDATLHNIILPPFKAAVEEAGVLSAMNSFNVRNGIPATADAYLQRDLLKGAWGFDGFVVTDWGSLIEMVPHGFAADHKEAALAAITAGVDIEMETGAYIGNLESLIESGDLDTSLIDDAVRRILHVKYELGLFEDPYRYLSYAHTDKTDHQTDEHRFAAREAAERSIVLLKNDHNTLPLTDNQSIAVIGALAADKDAPIANWRAQGKANSAISVLEGFDAAGINYRYAKGADVAFNTPAMSEHVQLNVNDRSGFDEALKLATSVDKVIMVLGEVAMQSGESRSRTTLGLPGVQQELLEAIHAVNPNIVLVVMSGRPLALSWADENIPAIVQTWHLGSESGHAIANVLKGDYNPSGKLPMTFPRSLGQVPIYYNRFNTGRPGPREDVWWSHYIDERNDPLYPFGHGLSYTQFDYSNLSVKAGKMIEVSVTVTNKGARAGEEVVQLYIWDKVASTVRPIRELKGFEKIALAPGKSKTVKFSLDEKGLGFYDHKGAFKTEPGEFEIFIGGSSATTLSKIVKWDGE